MAYKERVPVCGAILISEFWDKVRAVVIPRRLAVGSLSYRSFAGAPRQGLAEGRLVVVPSRQDQQGGGRRDVCNPRGAPRARQSFPSSMLTFLTGPRGNRLRPIVRVPSRAASSRLRRARRR